MNLFDFQLNEPLVLVLLSFLFGLWAAFVCRKSFETDRGMTITTALLPAIVACALLAINGSMGTGIAILGVFGLVRFRSIAGQPTDIASVFYAMCCGLLVSTGYIVTAGLLSLLIGLGFLAVARGANSILARTYQVRLSVPEDQINSEACLQVLEKYGKARLITMKTSHMGSLYDLVYRISGPQLTDPAAMLDELRLLNGNLPVSYINLENIEAGS